MSQIVPDESFVDETPRRPLIAFNNPWTGAVTGVLAFASLSLGMSICTMSYTGPVLGPLIQSLPESIQIAILVLIVVIHFVSVVGMISTLIHGLARTGNDAAVLIRGRRFSGMRLGVFYFGCYASVLFAWVLKFTRIL